MNIIIATMVKKTFHPVLLSLELDEVEEFVDDEFELFLGLEVDDTLPPILVLLTTCPYSSMTYSCSFFFFSGGLLK